MERKEWADRLMVRDGDENRRLSRPPGRLPLGKQTLRLAGDVEQQRSIDRNIRWRKKGGPRDLLMELCQGLQRGQAHTNRPKPATLTSPFPQNEPLIDEVTDAEVKSL